MKAPSSGGLPLFLALAVAAAAHAQGPMPLREVEHLPGQLLIKLERDVELVNADGLLAVSPELDALNIVARISAAELLFPRYRPAAIEALRASVVSGRATVSATALSDMEQLGRWVLLRLDQASDIEALARLYEALPEVAIAEPNYVMRLVGAEIKPSIGDEISVAQGAGFPNDPLFGDQWGLEFIDAPEAWSITLGSPSQVIAIIDTGVDLDHPDLVDKIWINPQEHLGDRNGDGCPGICLVDDDGDGLIDEDGQGRQPADAGYDPSYVVDDDENGYRDDLKGWDWVGRGQGIEDNDPQDDNGHGTHCAGIASAATNNGIGGAGVCPACRVMALKAFLSNGEAASSHIAQAIGYAFENGASVISMSFSSFEPATAIEDALRLASTQATLVAAAGNEARSRADPECGPVKPAFPASYSFVLGVEAGDNAGALAGFSNCGYEVRAPGAAIRSTVLNDSYTTWSGTSMAAPFIAGIAGLVRARHAANPIWTPDLVFGQLIQSEGNALQALSLVPEPRLVLSDYAIRDEIGSCTICDGDGIPDAGETVDIVVTVRNLWSAATGVAATLSTSDAFVTLAEDSSSFGTIGPSAFADNGHSPFRVTLSSAAENGHQVYFDLAVDAANGGIGVAQPIVLVVQRGVNRGGVLGSNETWTKDNLYVITQNLMIPVGVTLTIEPGTQIRLTPQVSMSVRGELVARGTSSERIEFLPSQSDGWGSILFQESFPETSFDEAGNYFAGSILEYCVIRGSSDRVGYPAVIEILYSNPYLARNIVDSNTAFPILVSGVSGGMVDMRIEENVFMKNTGPIHMPLGVFLRNVVVDNLVNINSTLGGWEHSAMRFGQGECERNSIFGNSLYDLETSGYIDVDVNHNFWGTTDLDVIAQGILDFFDDAARGVALLEPLLAVPDPGAPAVVVGVTLDPPSPVGAERVAFTVHFSRPMDNSEDPEVSFGAEEPYTDHPVNLDPTWLDDQTWQAEADITIFTGDGLQRISVTGIKDFDGFPLPSGDYRFSFVIDTSDTGSQSLSATGGAGRIDLSWNALRGTAPVAGYNLYRSTTSGGPYEMVNSAIITELTYMDFDVLPGVTYYYVLRTMTTNPSESGPSNEASAAALDNVAPVIVHNPLTVAPAGQLFTLRAWISDNIEVVGAGAFYRVAGSDTYTEVPMINATGNQYAANVPAESMVPAGLEYYLQATDGTNVARYGGPETPILVVVNGIFSDGFESGDLSAWSSSLRFP